MPVFIKNPTFDSVDALRVAWFWAAALGPGVEEDSSPQRASVEAAARSGPEHLGPGRPPRGVGGR